MTSCKNNKIKLQMICSYIESHVVANWMVTYYKISSNVPLWVVECFLSFLESII
jgi:hypothetical protein